MAAGYQGNPKPDQLFGGPSLSFMAGNMVLRDVVGNVVDGLNYGGIVDPWLAEGYQGTSGTGEFGNFVPSPGLFRGIRGGTAPSSQANRSAGRYPDGADSDNHRRDFLVQSTLSLLTTSPAGSDNIKVASVADFSVGQKMIIEPGTNSEIAVIQTVGASRGSTVGTATMVGSTIIPVANIAGFTTGQTITIDKDAKSETAVVVSVYGGGRGGQGGASITISTPLTFAHAVGAQVSSTCITFVTPFSKAHEIGAQVANFLPTPCAPNQYTLKP